VESWRAGKTCGKGRFVVVLISRLSHSTRFASATAGWTPYRETACENSRVKLNWMIEEAVEVETALSLIIL